MGFSDGADAVTSSGSVSGVSVRYLCVVNATRGPSQEEEDLSEDDITALEKMINEDDDPCEEVLFSILLAALKDPKEFSAGDMLAMVKDFGMESMIEEARVFKEDQGEDGDEGDPPEDAEVKELLEDIGELET